MKRGASRASVFIVFTDFALNLLCAFVLMINYNETFEDRPLHPPGPTPTPMPEWRLLVDSETIYVNGQPVPLGELESALASIPVGSPIRLGFLFSIQGGHVKELHGRIQGALGWAQLPALDEIQFVQPNQVPSILAANEGG